MSRKYSFGANKSPLDIRTFTYEGDKALPIGDAGESWANSKFIEDQHKVGICTAISITMKARKHFGIDFSDDFQYLLQKKFIDQNWNEGSSAFSACKAGNKYGFLPEKYWKHTTINDRKLSYSRYIEKLKAIPDEEIARLLKLSERYKVQAYAKVPLTTDALAYAIQQNGSVLARFVIGSEWWTRPIEPLRKPRSTVSGHLVNITKRVGDSYRIANSWGTDWADGGTAYGLFRSYAPTEMWQVWFADVPKSIEEQLAEKDELIGQLREYIQKLINIINNR
jgi:hypothetical protein